LSPSPSKERGKIRKEGRQPLLDTLINREEIKRGQNSSQPDE
jgi:hypothetical protein